jgi:hypothetical protein
MATPAFVDQFNEPVVIKNFDWIQKRCFFIDETFYQRLFALADVFIYQPLDDIYSRNSTSYLLPFLRPDCLKITLPFVTNISLWPFVMGKKGDLNDDWRNGDGETPVIRYLDPIDKLIKNGHTKDDILSMFDHDDINWDFSGRHEQMMNYVREKERGLSVQVFDFIEQNIRKKRLFAYYSHPAVDLSLFITNKIFQIFGLPSVSNEDGRYNAFQHGPLLECPTSTVKHFGLQFVSEAEQISADAFYRDKLVTYLNKL